MAKVKYRQTEEGTMTEYEFDKLCEQQTDCGCNCMKCELFAFYQNHKED